MFSPPSNVIESLGQWRKESDQVGRAIGIPSAQAPPSNLVPDMSGPATPAPEPVKPDWLTSLRVWGLVANAYQEQHPAVKEALKPIDTVVTATRDTVEEGYNITKGLFNGLAWLFEHKEIVAVVGGIIFIRWLTK